MAEPTALFWDVGGVVLTNAWDHVGRRAAADHFGLDGAELERRHEEVAGSFETGAIGLAQYLTATVFDRPRPFGREEFWNFMRSRSAEIGPALALARSLHHQGGPLMAALNNESLALNEYRIAAFHLDRVFDVFFSSCYTGRRKPDADAYRYALTLTQRDPADCLFIDDRPENVETAARLGMRTARVEGPDGLANALAREGIGVEHGGN